MPTPHKWASVIKAWADGAEVQYRHGDAWWDGGTAAPSFNPELEWRIKPKPQTVTYRVALFRYGEGVRVEARVVEELAESCKHFIRWLTDTVEVEI